MSLEPLPRTYSETCSLLYLQCPNPAHPIYTQFSTKKKKKKTNENSNSLSLVLDSQIGPFYCCWQKLKQNVNQNVFSAAGGIAQQ